MRFLRRLQVPASESQLAITIAVALIFLAAMLIGLVWQADVIASQREIIRALWNLKNVG